MRLELIIHYDSGEFEILSSTGLLTFKLIALIIINSSFLIEFAHYNESFSWLAGTFYHYSVYL